MNRSKSLAAKKTAVADSNPMYKSSKLAKPSKNLMKSSLNNMMFGGAPSDSLTDVVKKEQEEIKLKQMIKDKAME